MAGANDCQTDGDTGLVLMGHRYYDTRTGRFISQDPAGDGDNWYAYAGNSPTNAIDPSGLDEIDCDRVPSDWQQQALAMDSDYNGEAITTDDNGIIHWSDGTNDHSYCLNDMSGGADWSASPWIAMGAGGSSSGGGTQAAAISSFSSSFSSFFMQGSMGTNMGGRMFAAPGGGVPDSSLTTPAGAAEVGSLEGEGTTVGKPGNPFQGIEDGIKAAKDWLGKEVRAITNKDGDSIFMNKAGTKKLRFDINNPSPHENPHAHIEELVNGKWQGVGQIYPRDVPPR